MTIRKHRRLVWYWCAICSAGRSSGYEITYPFLMSLMSLSSAPDWCEIKIVFGIVIIISSSCDLGLLLLLQRRVERLLWWMVASLHACFVVPGLVNLPARIWYFMWWGSDAVFQIYIRACCNAQNWGIMNFCTLLTEIKFDEDHIISRRYSKGEGNNQYAFTFNGSLNIS